MKIYMKVDKIEHDANGTKLHMNACNALGERTYEGAWAVLPISKEEILLHEIGDVFWLILAPVPSQDLVAPVDEVLRHVQSEVLP